MFQPRMEWEARAGIYPELYLAPMGKWRRTADVDVFEAQGVCNSTWRRSDLQNVTRRKIQGAQVTSSRARSAKSFSVFRARSGRMFR